MVSLRSSVLVLILALCACATPVHAQLSPVATVKLGYGRQYPLQRFFPAMVEVSWFGAAELDMNNDAGNTFNARLHLTYAQDDTYTITVQRQITLREGIISRHPIYIRTSTPIEEMRVRLVHEDGRELGFWRVVPGSAVAGTIAGALFSGATVVEVGQRALQNADWVWGGSSMLVGMSELDTASISYPMLPTSWVGYDAIDVLILNDPANHALSGSQMTCLHEWVFHGGNLVIVAAADRKSYDMMFPENELGISIDQYGPTETPANFAFNLLETVRDVGRVDPGALRRQTTLNEAMFQASLSKEEQAITEALRDLDNQPTYHRLLAISPELRELGWTAHWMTDNLVRATPNDDGIGNMLTGPYGLGQITILGMDPIAAVRNTNRESIAVAWWHVTQHLPPMIELTNQWQRESRGPANTYSAYTTAADIEQMILNRHLNTVSEGFETSTGLFNLIALALLCLIIALGPLDFLVFRRLQRLPMTWLSCIVWIALASLVIFKGQAVVTSGVLEMRRVMTIDILSDDPDATCRYRAISALRSNRTATYGLDGLQSQQYLLPVAHREIDMYSSSTTPWVRAAVRQQDDRSHDLSIRVPMENVRWVEDVGFTERPPVNATLRRDGSELLLDISLPPDARLTDATINWQNRWYERNDGNVAVASSTRRFVRSRTQYNARAEFSGMVESTWDSDSESISLPAAFQASTHRGLTRFQDTIEEHPDKAILIATIENLTPSVSLRDHDEIDVRQTTFVRMLLDINAPADEEESLP